MDSIQVYSALSDILNELDDIHEIAILMSIKEFNDSYSNELPKAVQEHLFYADKNLAIQMEAIPLIIQEAQARFKLLKKNIQNLKDEDLYALDMCTRIMTVLNAKNYSAWNARKHIILNSIERWSSISKELNFLDLVLGLSPKTSEAWSHRKWVLNLNEGIDFDREWRICSKAAEKHKRNYYAWAHRFYIIDTFRNIDRLKQDFEFTVEWSKAHISDFSSLSYLCALLRILKCMDHEVFMTYMESEFKRSKEMLELFVGKESWITYRKHLWTLLSLK